MTVEVHRLTDNPTSAWQELSKSQRVIKITMKPPNPEIPANKVRVVCMSDTHSLVANIKFDVPDGDIFIHAGDFTKCGKREEVVDFNAWIGMQFGAKYERKWSRCLIRIFIIPGLLPHKHKLVIAGNHELSFDHTFTHPFQKLGNTGESDRRLHTGTHTIHRNMTTIV